ncbi:DNA-dependent protein kinase catalytic subunit-like [Amphibalanus amphitrite]|uniref:DNA-dependent protein kinase catalytic subunit-like n=1 Tax=Amphibalanus amphitrite TaxID=1232801 RepID=UPI001C917E4A|nr:DNA-dependent protein kinase catalytic subunit-like [Amphibalanus amphitrite]
MAAQEIQQLFRELQSVVCREELQGDPERAIGLILNIKRYLEEQFTDTDFQFILSVLFPPNDIAHGLMGLLQDVREIKEFGSFKVEGCRVTADLVSRAGAASLDCEAAGIRSTACLLSGRPQETSAVRSEALQLLITVLAAGGGRSTPAHQMAADLLSKDLTRAAPPTVRRQQLHLLGALCQHCPQQTAELAERACTALLDELKRQLDSRSAKLEMTIVSGAIQGLTCLLHSFSQSADDNPVVCGRIFDYVARVINPTAELSRREAPRAALALLATHAAQFSKHMYDRYVTLYSHLVRWALSNNRDDARAGVGALDAFINQVCEWLTTAPTDDGRPAKVFAFLLARLRELLDDRAAPPAVLSVAVHGYGALAAPCGRLHPPQELALLVTWLSDRAERLYLAGESAPPAAELLLQLPGHVSSLGCCLAALPTLPAAQLATGERLLLLLVEHYPRVPPTHRFLADGGVARCLLALLGRPELAAPCLRRLVYQMLLRCCSHALAVETELQKDSAVSYADRPLSYKDYLPLWDALLAAHGLRQLTRKGVSVAALQALANEVFAALVDASQKIICELDLSTQPLDGDAPPASGDPAVSLQARVPKDFQVFINLVSVLEHALLSDGAELRLRPWLPLLSGQVVATSVQRPLVSGLYRLARTYLLTAGRLGCWQAVQEDSDGAEAGLRRLWAAHVSETAPRCSQYRDELQEACVSMVLAAPAALAADCASPLLAVARLALRLGRSHLPLAARALDALESWLPALAGCSERWGDCVEPLRAMAPALSQYLAPEATVAAGGDRAPSSRRPSELTPLRRRALQLLGLLAAAGLVADSSEAELVAWSRRPVLGLDVPFSDVKPKLWLETFLPRTVQLALGSGDAQARTSACELLHAVTVFTLGRGAQLGMDGAGSLSAVYRRLLPALLRLAASPSLVARQLFAPLLTQITHWFTTDAMSGRPESALLLDVLLEGLVDAGDPARRDVSADALREYLQWSLKQRRADPVQKVAPLLEALYGHLRHPDPYRRLGATLAFNNLYRVFRESDRLLDVFLLEVTAALLAALARAHADPSALGTDTAAADALGHCQRILTARASRLLEKSEQRRVPAGWQGATLPDLLSWLVGQCGAPQTECRHACYRLLEALTPLAPAAGGLRGLVAAGGGAVRLLEHALTGVYRDLRGPVSWSAWLDALLAALDGYSWALQVGALPADRPIGSDSYLLDNIRFLMAEAFKPSFEDSAEAGRWAPVRRLRCTALVRALAVIEALLRAAPRAVTDIWSLPVCDTVAAAVLAPAELGFDVSEAEVVRELPAALDRLLRSVARYADAETRRLLTDSLARRAAGRSVCQALDEALSSQHDQHVAQQLRGLRTLQSSRLLSSAAPAELRVSGEELFAVVWESCGRQPPTDPMTVRLADTALETALALGVPARRLLSALLSEEQVRAGSGSAERGWLFFSRFSAVLVPHLLQPAAREAVLSPLVSRAAAHPRGVQLLTAVVRATAADRQLRRQYGAPLARLLAEGWQQLESASEPALVQLLGLLLLVHLPLASEDQAASPVAWYTRLLDGDRLTLEQKRPALRLLTIMLGSATLSANICSLLERLESRHFPLESSELAAGSPALATYRAVLASLCEALEMTAHPALARYMCVLMCREARHPCSSLLRAALTAAAGRHGTAQQLALAKELLALFWPAGGLPAAGRRTLLVSFLCPLLRAADRPVLLQFYTSHVVAIARPVQDPEPPAVPADSEPTEHQWVSRMGGFSLLEVLYASLPKDQTHAATSPLVTAFAGATARGNELTKALLGSGAAAFKAPPLRCVEPASLSEARRRCMCAAYCALAAAVSATQTEARFYQTFLLAEAPERNQLIWERLVDAERRYHLPVEGGSELRRWHVSIPRPAGAGGGQSAPRRTGSVSRLLADSSLGSQVTDYDFTASVDLSTQELQQQAEAGGRERSAPASLQLPADDLNEHECMACATALVGHLAERVWPLPEVGPPAQPAPWVTALCARLQSDNTPDNVLLFLCRLLTNCDSACRPYGRWLLPPLLRLLAAERLGPELNALLLDVLDMLAGWAQQDVTPEESSRADAGRLLEVVLRLTPSAHRGVVRIMLDVLEKLVSGWGDRAAFPGRLAVQLLTGDRQLHAPRAGVCALRAALLADRPLGLDGDEMQQLLDRLLTLMVDRSSTAELYRPASTVVALLCAGRTDIEAVTPVVAAKLAAVEKDDRVRWVTCLARLSAHCRPLAASQRVRLLFQLPSLHGEQKALGLQVLHDIIGDVPQLSSELAALRLDRLTEARDPQLRRAALQLLLAAAEGDRLSAGQWARFLPAVDFVVNHGGAPGRRLAAELCIELRRRFDRDDSEEAAGVRARATDALLVLLTDADLTVRQTAANYWADAGADTTPGRLSRVLTDMFRPGLEAAYLSYATYLVLGLTAQSPDFDRKMFDRALPESEFEEVAIVSDWRVQSAAAVPLFSQPAAGGGPLPALLRATQRSLAFTPTQRSAASQPTFDWLTQTAAAPAGTGTPSGARLRYTDDVDGGDGDAGADALSRMLRRRVETDARQVSARMARRHADQRALREDRQRDEPRRQDAQVELFRRYRRGELPDTEIPYSDLLRPLQALAMHDPPTAARLLAGLLVGTLHELDAAEQRPSSPTQSRKRPAAGVGADQLRDAVSSGLESVLRRLRTAEPSLVSAALQTALDAELALPPALLASVCRLSGQLPAGIMLLERTLRQPAAVEAATDRKRPRLGLPPPAAEPARDRDRLWSVLAELYVQYGDRDSARAALGRRADLAADWSAALEAEARGDFLEAARHYEQTIRRGEDHLSDQAYFQCLSELSEWGRLSRAVDQRLTADHDQQPRLDSVWLAGNDEQRDHLLPWLVVSKTQLAIERDGTTTQQLHQFLDAGLAEEASRHLLESRFPEELALRHVACGQLTRARHYCHMAQESFVRDWSAAEAAGGQSRTPLLQRLRTITELQQFLDAVTAPDPTAAASSLLDHWERNYPAAQESLAFWERLVGRRHLYVDQLPPGTRQQRYLRRSRLRLVEAALAQRNATAAGRQLGHLRSQQWDADDASLAAEYQLLRCQTAVLLGRDPVRTWRVLDDQVRWRDSAPPLPVGLLLRRARLEAELAERCLLEPAAVADPFVSQLLEESGHWTGDGARADLVQLAFGRLSAAVEAARGSPEAADACLEAARFCGRQLEALEETEAGGPGAELRGPFVRCTLWALAAGSAEACDWLPRLLQLADEHPPAAAALADGWEAVPEWRFLAWLPQLFSYGASAGCGGTVRRLLLRLAEQYPQALAYPLAASRADRGAVRPAEMSACLEQAHQLMANCRLPERLVAELGRLGVYSRLRSLCRHLQVGQLEKAAGALADWGGLAAVLSDPPSEADRQLLRLCGDNGERITTRSAPKAVDLIKKRLAERPASRRLGEFSGWLASFQDVNSQERLELPGQYTGRRRPQPDYHVRVANLSDEALVLNSIERPVRITVRGDDAREYRYLIKAGDDLRTDQRVQQLFRLLNGALAAEPAAADRRLALTTYTVLPVHPTLGIIQWLDHTSTLHQFIGSACPDLEQQCAEARELFRKQMRRHATQSGANDVQLQSEYARRAPRDVVVADLAAREALMRDERGRACSTLLQQAVFRLSSGPEALLRLRTRMAESHALLCAAGWLLGVGDRHLGNFLVSLEDGAMIGIDFGHVFGSATSLLPVPELVPFRLTAQLAGLTAPLGPAGLTRHTLLRAVRALRSSRHLLAAALQGFVREPAAQWTEHQQQPAEHARRCVRQTRGRLCGSHPAADVCQLLAGAGRLSAQEVEAWSAAARGRRGHEPRAELADAGLTAEQQVDCLLELATDRYVLGLAYSGWAAHV